MQWRYKISSEQESSALLSATKLCKLFTSQSEDQPPQLSRSIARVAQGDSEEYKKIEDFPELMQILAQLEDPEYQKQKKEKKKLQKKRKASKAPSNCVYISGLPEDISSDEIFAHFKNIGSIQDDFITGKPRIKIYESQDGNCKGDALLYFEKDLSVASAIHYLNQSQIRPGVKIKVAMAEFDQNENSEEVQGEKKKLRLDKAQLAIKKKLEMKRQKDKFSWDEDEDRTSGMRIVVFKNMFSPEDAQNDEEIDFFEELEKDIGLECQRIGGDLEKITIFKNNPEGVIAVKFKEAHGADKIVESMNGRWFAGRRIQVEYFDGVTNYKKMETIQEEDDDDDEEEEERLEKFGEWLEKS